MLDFDERTQSDLKTQQEFGGQEALNGSLIIKFEFDIHFQYNYKLLIHHFVTKQEINVYQLL